MTTAINTTPSARLTINNIVANGTPFSVLSAFTCASEGSEEPAFFS